MFRNGFRVLFNKTTTTIGNGYSSEGVIGRKAPFVSTFHKTSQNLIKESPNGPNYKRVPLLSKIRDNILLLEARQGIVGKAVVGIGQGVAAGALVFASGAGIYYGFVHKPNLTSIRTIEFDEESSSNSGYLKAESLRHLGLPEYVQDRVRTAYMYFTNSLAVSALAAGASFRLFRNIPFLNLIAAYPLPAIGITMASQFLVTMIVSRLPYEEGFGMKQAGSLVQGALIGLTAGPMYLLGAQSIIRAGFVTAGIIGGLTGISAIVPHDAFVKWETPLRIGMHTVFLAFMSLWFIPGNLGVYKILYRVAMHGGLVIFPAYYLFNSKAVVQSAMFAPHFDPINASMSMYMDVLNVYGRLAFLLPPPYLISGDTRRVTQNAVHSSSSNDSK